MAILMKISKRQPGANRAVSARRLSFPFVAFRLFRFTSRKSCVATLFRGVVLAFSASLRFLNRSLQKTRPWFLVRHPVLAKLQQVARWPIVTAGWVRADTEQTRDISWGLTIMSVGEGAGAGAGIGFDTMRGRDYPSIRQFTVFLENRVGQLMEVVRKFEGSQVRIVALSISDSTECALVRFLLSDPEAGREILERAGFPIVESDLIGVELPEVAQPLLFVCTALLAAEVNITQVYPLLVQPTGRPAVALMVDNIEMALDTLTQKRLRIINEDELRDYNP